MQPNITQNPVEPATDYSAVDNYFWMRSYSRLKSTIRFFFLFVPFAMIAPGLQKALMALAREWHTTVWNFSAIWQDLSFAFIWVFFLAPFENYVQPVDWIWPISVSALNAVSLV